MSRERHAILVQLADGPEGAAQEAAIRTLAPRGQLSAYLRARLLAAARGLDAINGFRRTLADDERVPPK